jgi:hypothetical protein
MDLSVNQLEEAVRIRREIDRLQNRLTHLFGSSDRSSSFVKSGSTGGTSSSSSAAKKTGGKRRRGLSAAGRARIAAAAKARWARLKSSGGNSASATGAGKGKSKPAAKTAKTAGARRGSQGISEAGRKKLSQMMKARWAARRKAQEAS